MTEFSIKTLYSYLENTALICYGLTFLALLVCFLFLLPFYVYVNKVNRERDKLTPIFPITNHFYEMSKVCYFSFLYLIISFLLTIVLGIYESLYYVLSFFTFCITCFLLYVIVQVFHILISFLALQRLLLYFSPNSEKWTKEVQNVLCKNLRYIYTLFGFKEIIGICWGTVCLCMECNAKKKLTFEIFYMSTFFLLNSLLIISALFYIPITVSVWKLSNLPMTQQSRPHRYIFYQTIVILIIKSICIPAVLAIIYFGASINVTIIFIIFTDIIIIPLIIQMSYLGCNRRNMEILFKNFSVTKFLRVLLDMNGDVVVEPRVGSMYFTRYSNSSRRE